MVGAAQDFTAPAASRARACLPAAQAMAPACAVNASIHRPFSSAIVSTLPSAEVLTTRPSSPPVNNAVAVARRDEDRAVRVGDDAPLGPGPADDHGCRRRAPGPVRRR